MFKTILTAAAYFSFSLFFPDAGRTQMKAKESHSRLITRSNADNSYILKHTGDISWIQDSRKIGMVKGNISHIEDHGMAGGWLLERFHGSPTSAEWGWYWVRFRG